LGFPPAKQGQRRKLLKDYASWPMTLVFYEAPHRILDTLADIVETLGARPVVLAREVTKIHEEFLQGTAAELLAALGQRPPLKGEITLMIGKSEAAETDDSPLDLAVEELIQAGVPRMQAFKTVARRRGLPKREVYKKLTEHQ